MNTIRAKNIPDAYSEAIYLMKMWVESESSRNGPVLTSAEPVLLEVNNPTQRVLFDKIRNCNPFFHVMEFVWMMAGENNVKWISQFNHKFVTYADKDSDVTHGAYGHRWIKHFGRNQIQAVGDLLREDPTTRRAVIAMWDPRVDLVPHNDLPCNTQIMFRVVGGCLDMTVVNRSNDMIWGMLGANAVHMTYLHELIGHISGIPLGFYKVFTNNLHVYTEMPNFEAIWNGPKLLSDHYRSGLVEPYALLDPTATYENLVEDCINLIHRNNSVRFKTDWMLYVAYPMYMAYMDRLGDGGSGMRYVRGVEASDWKLACENYIEIREGK